jgi:hypothetical protein
VNIDSLIGSYFRRSDGRYMSFTESPAGTQLPSPDPARSLCPFCSFHRVKFKKDSAQQYFQALRREVELVTGAGYRFGELYIGGGTPTVLPDDLIRTIELVCDLHQVKHSSVETTTFCVVCGRSVSTGYLLACKVLTTGFCRKCSDLKNMAAAI